MKSVNISKNLKQLLIDNNKANIDLANYLNVSDSLISSYITKNTLPPIDKLIKISYFFNVSIDELIFEKKDGELNSILQQGIESPSNTFKKFCVLTGGDCSFREMDMLRIENERLRKENEKLKIKK